MQESLRQKAAAKFAESWAGKGYEKGESQKFWLQLLHGVFGIDEPGDYISFENQVKLNHTSFIDAYIDSTKVMIEQKSIDKDLTKPVPQSDGSLLTPIQQAKRYLLELPVSKHPRWVIACNFKEFHIYDMEQPQRPAEVVLLENLEREYTRLQFLVDEGNIHVSREMEVSIQAGQLVGKLYEAFLEEYVEPHDAETLRWLNILCVRLVFCLYAEDAGLFGSRHTEFYDYLHKYEPREMRSALKRLFHVMNTPPAERDPYEMKEDEDLAKFPYCAGGLFHEMYIQIPTITDKIAELLLEHASNDFDWALISPTIFGAVFESTLNPETRRTGGMHYTSVENIHKVIDPLFLDDLQTDFEEICKDKVEKQRRKKLVDFQDKLASLKFLDPACGSGNFLTETYLSLRRLENEVIRQLYHGQAFLGFDEVNPIKIDINQFYGIEINDFAVTVAATALWIAEAQMQAETERIINVPLEYFPLKSYEHIHEANALRIDWNEVVHASELNYIIGNPPFVGARLMSATQKEDMLDLFGKKWKNIGNMDYVSAWYKKAADMMQGTNIRAALVSTNSICQGEQVTNIWKPLMEDSHVHIDFGYRTFRWDSESSLKAHVHCVIVGFSVAPINKEKYIFEGETKKNAENINGYLLNAPSVFIDGRSKPISNVQNIMFGNMPNDGGYLSDYSKEDKDSIISKHPEVSICFRKFVGATEFINNKERWCLWLKGIAPNVYRNATIIVEAITKVKELRAASNRPGTRKMADFPMLFGEIRHTDTDYLLIPCHSSQNRKYIPIGFMPSAIICSNANMMISDATLYSFGIMESNVHMAWVSAVCGRIKSDFRYSANIVYNNFSWPTPTEAQKQRIEQTAQAILDARNLYPKCSLADLYDEVTMPPELRKAHQENDRAVMEAYGFPKNIQEADIVARLLEMYEELTSAGHGDRYPMTH